MFSRINIDNILLMSIQDFYINTTLKRPQSFTGKERDSETGFSYFGARFYDSDILTGWLSVDPLADKYPSLSPYAYCAWNPVKLVDPDGRDGVLKVDGNNLIVELTINYTEETLEKAKKIDVDYNSLKNDVNNFLTSKNGIYNICGTDYNVKFDISFNKVEKLPTDIENRYGEVNLIFEPGKNSADHLKNVIKISSPRRNYERNDLGGSLSHEILHTLGLKDSSNPEWLSSYDMNRYLHPEEVVIMLEPCINLINNANITNGKITIPRSKKLTNGTRVRDNPHKIN